MSISTKLPSCISFLVAMLSVSPLFAHQHKGYFQAAGFAGISHISASQTHMDVSATENDTLTAASNNSFQGGLGINYVMPRRNTNKLAWLPEAKVGVFGYGFANSVEGEVWLYNNPALYDYDYNLDIESFRLMLDLNLSVLSCGDWSLFVLGGVGPSWNWLTYKENPRPGVTDGALSFKEYLDVTFAWELGAGIAYEVTEQLDITAHYLYTNLGTVSTGTGPSTSANPLIVPEGADFNLYTNSVFLGLQWAF